MKNQDAEYWIEKLKMETHPEGGFYSEVFRSNELIPESALAQRFRGNRNYYSTIYYLLKRGQISKIHRLQADEIWHYYYGSPLNIVILESTENVRELLLGPDPDEGQSFQQLVPAGYWFGAYPLNADDFSLVGCTLAPGFDYNDIELANRKELLEQFPIHKEIIEKLT